MNFVDFIHSISHSPTERTVSESRTIDLKNLVESMARKKHSGTVVIIETVIRISFYHTKTYEHFWDLPRRLKAGHPFLWVHLCVGVFDTHSYHRPSSKCQSHDLVLCPHSSPNDLWADRTTCNYRDSPRNSDNCRCDI